MCRPSHRNINPAWWGRDITPSFFPLSFVQGTIFVPLDWNLYTSKPGHKSTTSPTSAFFFFFFNHTHIHHYSNPSDLRIRKKEKKKNDLTQSRALSLRNDSFTLGEWMINEGELLSCSREPWPISFHRISFSVKSCLPFHSTEKNDF